MKKNILITLLICFYAFNIFANEPKLDQIINGLDNPWSLTFVNNDKMLITEKSGNLLLVNLSNKKLKKLNII